MKSVLVTGVTRGIGRSIAEEFLNNGYHLYGTYNCSKNSAKELIEKYGDERVSLFGNYDFRDLSQVADLIDELKAFKFDSIVCNAGMFSDNDDFNCFELSIFEETMHCNFYAPLMLCVLLKENLVDNGSIVLISSNDAYAGGYTSMSYSISKSALISLMKCLCVNYGNRGIRVNSVAPGAVDTDMNTAEMINIAPCFTPLSRVGHPKDIAKVVYALSSEEFSFVNGENITIDGGYGAVSVLLKCENDQRLSNTILDHISKEPDS